MTPNPQLPPRECFNCQEGNRTAVHVRTERARVESIGPNEDENLIAVFYCPLCDGVTREAFDPKSP